MAVNTVTPADRIRDLSAINKEVAEMLQSAGQAINALTNGPLIARAADDEDAHMESDEAVPTMEQRKTAFAQNTKDYYTRLQAIVARLKRQAYALEEAGIIAPEASIVTGTTQQKQGSIGALPNRGSATAVPVQETERITNGGLGNLDVGWLNSRGNKVGIEKENELIEGARKLLEETVAAQHASQESNGT